MLNFFQSVVQKGRVSNSRKTLQQCHGAVDVPWPATRCLWVLSTWLVVCCWCHVLFCLLSLSPPILLPNHCFSCSTCVSLITLVCLSLFSLLVSVVLCWSVIFLCVRVMLTVQTVLCQPACFSPSGWFLFIFVFILLLKTRFPCIWVLAISRLTHPDKQNMLKPKCLNNF